MLYSKIKNMLHFEIVETIDSDSWFRCYLTDQHFIEVSMYSFYHFVSKNDRSLELYLAKFDSWEEATRDLLELEYPFEERLNEYLKQFTNADYSSFIVSVLI